MLRLQSLKWLLVNVNLLTFSLVFGQTPNNIVRPKNVILMIGDGMGAAQVAALMQSSKTSTVAFQQFPVVGFQKTYSHSDLVTDSGAAATAIACGLKTYNNSIGMNADSLPCPSIIDDLEAMNLATGIVVTSTIVHATPAAFISNQTLRVEYEDIAVDILHSGLDLFIGGGKDYFNKRESDKRDLIDELKSKGYFVSDIQSRMLERIPLNTSMNLAYFTHESQPHYVSDGRNYLPYASKLAVNFLDQKATNGFFLLIEGSQIDWAGHKKNADNLLLEMIDFERAISEVLAFAKDRDDTLIIITGDHETGGLSVVPDSKNKKADLKFTTNGHTATMVPVYAFGLGAALFAGIYENIDIHAKIKQALGLGYPPSAMKGQE